MAQSVLLSSLLLISLLLSSGYAFYLPGVAPREFQDGESIIIKVQKLTSTKTQLPYEFYTLPYCRPDNVVAADENLGEILFGDRIETSPFEIQMKTRFVCRALPHRCNRDYSAEEIKQFTDKIDDDYYVQMILDNLPAATLNDDSQAYRLGFPVGVISREGEKYINNHLNILVKYHTDPSYTGSRIVGFEVRSASVKHDVADDGSVTTCDDSFKESALPLQPAAAGSKIAWTYSVTWEYSDVKWASRWDVYLKMSDSQIHWFSIVNSVMIVLFLTGMVAMIMMRTLHKDFQRYHQLEQNAEDAQEETGWKLVHGDVFRAPARFNLLSALAGTGVQILGMCVVTLIFAALGFLSPANRGGLMTAVLLLFVFMGIFAGYFSSRLYKMFKGQAWQRNTLMTALLFPGIVFGIFFVLNLFVWGQHSSGAVPFGTLVALMALWFGISVPLVYLGAYFGFRKQPIEHPVRTNQIPREIPEQPWYMRSPVSVLMGGILPFGAVFIELFFILSSLWLNQFYYVFGFLFLVFVILAITCSEITIVMVYFQLCSEDYNWWWRSFTTAGSSAVYLFLYSMFYFATRLAIKKFVSGLLFFGYMSIISFFFFVLTGTIGFYSCFWFVRKIYGSIKVD